MKRIVLIVCLVGCSKSNKSEKPPAPPPEPAPAAPTPPAPAPVPDATPPTAPPPATPVVPPKPLTKAEAKEFAAEVETLATGIAAIDPVEVLPPCKPEDIGGSLAPMEAVDQPSVMKAPPPGSDAAWPWLDTPLFADIVRYRNHAFPDEPAALRERLHAVDKVMVYVAEKHVRAAKGVPATFDGWIYFYDRTKGMVRCQLALKATADSDDAMKKALGDQITDVLTAAGLGPVRPSVP